MKPSTCFDAIFEDAAACLGVVTLEKIGIDGLGNIEYRRPDRRWSHTRCQNWLRDWFLSSFSNLWHHFTPDDLAFTTVVLSITVNVSRLISSVDITPIE